MKEATMIEQPESLVTFDAKWNELFQSPEHVSFLEETVLPDYLKKCRWFGGKAKLFEVSIHTFLIIEYLPRASYQLLLTVSYDDETTELYNLCISYRSVGNSDHAKDENAVICKLGGKEPLGYIIDSYYDPAFRTFLFQSIQKEENLQVGDLLLQFQCGKKIRGMSHDSIPASKLMKVEQSNSSIIFDNSLILKLFRRVEFVTNPDLEVTRFLTRQTDFNNIPAFQGVLQLIIEGRKSTVLGLMQDLIPNQGDAWELFQKEVQHYFDEILSDHTAIEKPPAAIDIMHYSFQDIKRFLKKLIGNDVFNKIEILAKRTAEMHIALSSHPSDADFAPEAADEKYRKKLYKSLKKLVQTKFHALAGQLNQLPADVADDAKMVIAKEKEILRFFKKQLKKKIKASRIRLHGDYHLGQVLFTGSDFIILDFEGEPEKPYKERRKRQMALKDVAGMIRSFHYVINAVMLQKYNDASMKVKLNPWAELWYHAVSRFFLETYIETSEAQIFLPKKKSLVAILQLFLLEKSIYELGYEMNNRPTWVSIPIQGIKYFITNYIQTREVRNS